MGAVTIKKYEQQSTINPEAEIYWSVAFFMVRDLLQVIVNICLWLQIRNTRHGFKIWAIQVWFFIQIITFIPWLYFFIDFCINFSTYDREDNWTIVKLFGLENPSIIMVATLF